MLRFVVFALLFGAFAGAQEPAPTDPPKDPAAIVKKPAERPTPSKICAIPLLNVLPRVATAPMPRVDAPSRARFFIKQIQPPAPSCDDRKK